MSKVSQLRKKPKRTVKGLKNYSLPDKPNEISEDMSDYIWLIYGERKIGKTTILSEFDNVFFLLFDPPNKGLKIYQKYCETWSDFLGYLDELEANPDYCKMVVIDTGFMAYERCFAHVCKEHGVKDPRDKGWAVVWKDIARQFMEAHDRILNMGLGLAVTAHSDVREITQRDGSSYHKLTTQLSNSAQKYYNGLCDVIGYYHYNKKGSRILTLKGDSFIEAGSRIQEHFIFTDGSPVDSVPMGKSHIESFQNLKKAFNNKLVKPLQTKSKIRNTKRS